jgi:hypothetical protein
LNLAHLREVCLGNDGTTAAGCRYEDFWVMWWHDELWVHVGTRSRCFNVHPPAGEQRVVSR